MNDGKINLGEALRNIERNIIPKADKNFKKNFDDRLFNYLSKESKVRIPKGVHAVLLGPPKKIIILLSQIVNIYLDMFVARKKIWMQEANEEAKENGNEPIYSKATIDRVTGKKLLQISPTFRQFIDSELNRIEVYPSLDYEVIIDMIPLEGENGEIEFWNNLQSDIVRARAHELYPDTKIPDRFEGNISLPNVTSINLSCRDIYERASSFVEVLEELDFDKDIPKEFRDVTKFGRSLDEQTNKIYKLIENAKKQAGRFRSEVFYEEYFDEIKDLDPDNWNEYLDKMEKEAINKYRKFNKASEQEAKYYWKGLIEKIEVDENNTENTCIDKYFNTKDEGILNLYIGTNNRSYARKEYRLLIPKSSDEEFNKYYDHYYLRFRKKESIKNKIFKNSFIEGIPVRLTSNEGLKFNKAYIRGVYSKGAPRKIKSIEMLYILTKLDNYKHWVKP